MHICLSSGSDLIPGKIISDTLARIQKQKNLPTDSLPLKKRKRISSGEIPEKKLISNVGEKCYFHLHSLQPAAGELFTIQGQWLPVVSAFPFQWKMSKGMKDEQQSRWCQQAWPAALKLAPPMGPCSVRGHQSEHWVAASLQPDRCQVGLINTPALRLPYKWYSGQNVEAWEKEKERWINPSAHIHHTATLWNEVELCGVDEPAKRKKRKGKK